MIVEEHRTKPWTGSIWLSVLVLMLGVLCFGNPSALADSVKRRIIPVTINKGQNYTISGVQPGTVPATKVINNPNALVVQNAPGRVELLGADNGKWNIKVTLATGEKVIYAVTIKAEAPPQGDLVPAAAPTAMR
ncbi:MAG: hypothetical protein HY269_09115 [Deltaproteobacteria bacterium]|nr:hypothetical protein [Deltaproteobacteria bacterium]